MCISFHCQTAQAPYYVQVMTASSRDQTATLDAVAAFDASADDTGAPHERRCAAEGCNEEAPYRAPRSREALRDYIFFCLEHVRDYNKQWNYYAGLEGDALEAEIKRSATWERPSWSFGTGGRANHAFDDTLGLFAENGQAGNAGDTAPGGRRIDDEERRAWKVMRMQPVADIEQVKLQYKRLAKAHHPDLNGSDKGAEERLERLKEINLAYDLIRRNLQAGEARAGI